MSRRQAGRLLAFAVFPAAIFAVAVDSSAQVVKPKSQKSKRLAHLPKSVPAPKDNPTTPQKVALGKQLFFDPRLSGDNKTSCATCHLPQKAFADGLAKAKGAGSKTLRRNTPGLLNVGFYSSFFWDGRSTSLEGQALSPIQAANEMNQNLAELETELGTIPAYVGQFQSVFGTRVTRDGIAKALAAFQRSLVTKPSPFDRYLAGDQQALSEKAKEGLRLFREEADCIRCHNGPLLSDGKYYRLGVSFKDKGRADVTGKQADNYKFRTPSLRNIAWTGPYMHDGSLETLEEVVFFYFRGAPTRAPDGRPLDIRPLMEQSFSDIEALVEFLKALNGEAPDLSVPKLP